MAPLSPYLIAIVVGWLTAHIIKYTVAVIRGQKLDLTHQMFISGGMPSSHAATTVAVWMVVLLKDGLNSGLFGLATLVTLIICYDAVKVRRSSGEQGEAIAQLIKESKSTIKLPRAAKGHTPLEVFIGAILGGVIGLVVFLATR
jgi:acid phosphatase family membrane protein YuiD